MTNLPTTPPKVHHKTGAGASINPDSIGMFRAVTVGVFITFFAQVAISATALYLVGVELHMGTYWSAVVPLGIDVPILVFTGAALIFKRRGRKFQRLFATFLVLLITLVSCWLNHLVHVDTVSDTPIGQAALMVATIAPLLIYGNVEILTALVTKEVPKARVPAVKKPVRKRATATQRRTTPKVAVATEAIPSEGRTLAA